MVSHQFLVMKVGIPVVIMVTETVAVNLGSPKSVDDPLKGIADVNIPSSESDITFWVTSSFGVVPTISVMPIEIPELM